MVVAASEIANLGFICAGLLSVIMFMRFIHEREENDPPKSS